MDLHMKKSYKTVSENVMKVILEKFGERDKVHTGKENWEIRKIQIEIYTNGRDFMR